MHRQWVKLWRRIEDCEIWDMPPLYTKIWFWLLIKANRSDGHIDITQEQIADRLQWVDRNQPKIPSKKLIRDILMWLESQGMIKRTVVGKGSRKYTRLVIVNWDTYQSRNAGPESVMNQNRTRNGPPSQEGTRSTKKTKSTTYVASDLATRALTFWEEHRSLPARGKREDYLKIFDDMHRLDKIPWNGETGIGAIINHALAVWTRGMIQSPAKLRRRSATNPDMTTWEIIQGQIEGQQEQRDPILGDGIHEMPGEKPK